MPISVATLGKPSRRRDYPRIVRRDRRIITPGKQHLREANVVGVDVPFVLERDRGRWNEASEILKKARELLEKLTRNYPQVPRYRNELAECCLSLGSLYSAARRKQDWYDRITRKPSRNPRAL